MVTIPIQYSPATDQGYYFNNLVALAEYLMQNGYSAAAAAGVAGAVAGESSGNPESQGSGGAGLIAWTPPTKASPIYPIVTGDPNTDFTNQLADILTYNEQQGSAALNTLNQQTNPVTAADDYSQAFERPAVTDSDVRPAVAQAVYQAVQGQPVTGSLGSTTTATTTSSILSALSPAALVSGLTSGLASSTGTASFKDLLVRGGLIGLGAVLVIVGLIMLAGHQIETTVNLAGKVAK